ncbi:MAG: hypothetical protein WC461_00115 [Candidatus Paceibacterota bacterium]
MTNGENLFSGEHISHGGLSNAGELADICPAVFQNDNSWSRYARKLFYLGGNITGWKWKLNDEEKQRHQFICFQAILVSFKLGIEARWGVAGWMLSEMLSELPTHVPIKKR